MATAPIFLQTALVPSASGSAYIERAGLKVSCSVFGPRQVKGRQYAGKAELNVQLKYAPFSSVRRRKPGKTTESPYLSALVHQALLPALRLDLLPKASLDVHITVLESHTSQAECVAAATIAASTALASAGIDMYALVVAAVAHPDPHSSVLLCAMPALNSLTCLQVLSPHPGSNPSILPDTLVALNLQLANVHAVVARALAQDHQRRQASLQPPPPATH